MPSPLPHEQSETFLSSAMAQAAHAADQPKAVDAAPDNESALTPPDAVERIATRAGRIFGFIALPGLVWLFGRQLGWW